MHPLARLLSTMIAGSGSLTRVLSGVAAAIGAATVSIARGPEVGESLTKRNRWNAESVLDDQVLDDQNVSPSLGTLTIAPSESGLWTAARLRETLHAHLHGERVFVVANREPVIHEWHADHVVVRHPASGLVTALEPVMRACSGVWVAHGGGSADRAAADPQGRVAIDADGGSYLASASLAHGGGGAGLLLWVCQRGALAAVPPRARAAGVPPGRLDALPHGQPALRRHGLGRSRFG